MSLEAQELPIPGAMLLRAPVRGDERGAFVKTFHRDSLATAGIDAFIAEQYYSVSQRGVIRGLHFQLPPADHKKFVYCSRGRALDVLVDLRADSPRFGAVVQVEIAALDGTTVYIPPGIAHGFQSLEDDTMLHYAVTSVYSPEHDAGVRWDSAGVEWDASLPEIVSERDRDFPTLAAFESPFRLDRS